MKASDYDDALLEEHLDRIASNDVRRAALVLIQGACSSDRIDCRPAMQGAIRTFRYLVDDQFAFAFIFNVASVLFYVRKPALDWSATKSVLDAWSHRPELPLTRNQAGEITIRVVSEQQARIVNDSLITPLLALRSERPPPSFAHENSAMTESIFRPAALVRQGQLRLYTTSLKAKHLLVPGFYDIERLDPSNVHDRGYQRVLNTARAKRLGDYLVAGQEHHDAFLPTSIFLATDKELNFDAEKNVLEINLDSIGPFSVVDGQHRLEGLRLAAEKEPRIASFEVPVNIAVGLSKIAQMCHFLIVNTTQKSVDKAVEQRLIARLTEMVEIEDVPTLPKWIRRVVESGDDADALRLIDYLNQTPDSPWLGRIAMPNMESEDATVSQKSFVISIKKYVLAASNPLVVRPTEQQQKIFLNYWRAISDELGTDEETVLFKSIGVDLFCRFSGTIFAKLQNGNNFSVQATRTLLRQTFDNMEGDYAGLGQPDWWLSGSGPAGRLNASALGKINQELARALHRSEGNGGIVL